MRLVVVVIRRRLAILSLLLLTLLLILPKTVSLMTVLSWHILRTPVDVVIDPGHGGVDPGANDHDTMEKDITLLIALQVRDMLVRYGISVGLTRSTDTDCSGWSQLRPGRHLADLNQRARMTNKGKIGISIHVNSSSDPNQKGAMVLYAAGSDPGRALADEIISQLALVTDLNHSKPVPRSNLLVLNATQVPTILVEVGFLSNPTDKARMKDEAFRYRLAEALARGVINYFTTTSSAQEPSAQGATTM
ncbi:MAG: N-acetylmuramoyl-L-alanine amidase family protein [Bacillota bacterium]